MPKQLDFRTMTASTAVNLSYTRRKLQYIVSPTHKVAVMLRETISHMHTMIIIAGHSRYAQRGYTFESLLSPLPREAHGKASSRLCEKDAEQEAGH